MHLVFSILVPCVIFLCLQLISKMSYFSSLFEVLFNQGTRGPLFVRHDKLTIVCICYDLMHVTNRSKFGAQSRRLVFSTLT